MKKKTNLISDIMNIFWKLNSHATVRISHILNEKVSNSGSFLLLEYFLRRMYQFVSFVLKDKNQMGTWKPMTVIHILCIDIKCEKMFNMPKLFFFYHVLIHTYIYITAVTFAMSHISNKDVYFSITIEVSLPMAITQTYFANMCIQPDIPKKKQHIIRWTSYGLLMNMTVFICRYYVLKLAMTQIM